MQDGFVASALRQCARRTDFVLHMLIGELGPTSLRLESENARVKHTLANINHTILATLLTVATVVRYSMCIDGTAIFA
jgi:hypothetical protein